MLYPSPPRLDLDKAQVEQAREWPPPARLLSRLQSFVRGEQ